MPQLVKGGKHVFGWSLIRDNGSIIIPAEAFEEYKLTPGADIVLFSGSKTSGGFIAAKKSLLEESFIGSFLSENPELTSFQKGQDNPFAYKTRKYIFTQIQSLNTLKLNNETLEAYGLKTGDYLLSARGSNIGIAMIVKGPIVEYAKTHPEIKRF
jgi:bifunctional DNA-binding transcriptional regulator/antitoxin component of YhaV-PrlF toxin-antitoxin module